MRPTRKSSAPMNPPNPRTRDGKRAPPPSAASSPSKRRKTTAAPASKIDLPRLAKRVEPVPKISLESSGSGDLLVYGSNDAGQLGLPDVISSKTFPFLIPMEKLGGEKAVKVVCGGLHSLVITESGKVWSWGCNDEGALGTSSGKSAAEEDDSYVPKHISAVGEKVVAVSAGDSHSAFLTEEGHVYLTVRINPSNRAVFDHFHRDLHGYLITAYPKVGDRDKVMLPFKFGTMRDANGAFGIHSQKSDYISTPFLLISSKPLRNNDSVARDRAVKISSGDNHFAYLNSKNEVHLLGDGSSGQLGPVSRYRSDGGRLGRSYFLQRRRVFIASAKQGRKLLEFEDVWCTPAATFIRVKGEDTWFACGNNRRNQLGVPTLPLAGQEGADSSANGTSLGSTSSSTGVQAEWVQVEGLRGKSVVKVVGTAIQTLALTSDGCLYVFGDREYLGLSDSSESGQTDGPILHPSFGSASCPKLIDVGCSSNGAVVVVDDKGLVYVWGSFASGVLGVKEEEERSMLKPERMQSKNTEAYRMLQVAVGAQHGLLVGQAKE